MEIKTYYGDWDPKLNVGLIWECEEDKDFGVVVGYRIEKISASVSCKDFGPKLYYFKKDKSVVKYRYDIVIFLLTKEYELEVTEVLDISEYKLVFPTSKNYSPSRRADGIYHHDSVWEEIEKGVPIIETGDLKKMHLPKIISTDSQGLPSRIELYEGLAIENQELLINSYLDYKKHGGAPIIGLEKIFIKVHGNTQGEEITNAIYQAKTFIKNNVNKKIASSLKE